MSFVVKGGLSKGGEGNCRIGRGGMLDDKGSVTPGMEGIKGGNEMALALSDRTRAARAAVYVKERIANRIM